MTSNESWKDDIVTPDRIPGQLGNPASYASAGGSGVAGAGVCVVSVEGRGPGAVPPGNFFRFPPPKQWVFL